MPHRDWVELREFVGADKFDPALANGDDGKVLAEFARHATPAEFYAKTDIYLYHCIAYSLEGVKRPYFARLFDELPHGRPSVIDYGCGAGEDGLLLYRSGLTVSWADIPSRAFDFLIWRLPRHINAGLVFTIGEDAVPHHNYVWCMDVLEHIDPGRHAEFLDYLAAIGQRVFVNLVADPDAQAGGLHNPVDVAGLTQYVAGRHADAEWHDYYGGRVRLLMYGRRVEQGDIMELGVQING